jgi:hypothetical protein
LNRQPLAGTASEVVEAGLVRKPDVSGLGKSPAMANKAVNQAAGARKARPGVQPAEISLAKLTFF